MDEAAMVPVPDGLVGIEVQLNEAQLAYLEDRVRRARLVVDDPANVQKTVSFGISGMMYQDTGPFKMFKQYRRSQIAELRQYHPGESIRGVSISDVDKNAGSPKLGDMIARNPKNHNDQWLVSEQYFNDNFESVDAKR